VFGEVADVLGNLGSFDEPFVAWRLGSPPAATVACLSRFPAVLPTEWNDLDDALLDVAEQGSATIPWWTALEQAGELAAEDPLAGAAAGLYALAAWQATRRMTGPLDDGWFTVPPRVAELLLDAGGFRGAGELVSASRQHIERVVREYYRPAFVERMAPYRRATDRIAATWLDAKAELAYDLRTACRRGDQRMRAGIAALFWLSGDAPRAELIADDPSYTPALDAFTELISAAIRSIADDLLMQHGWLALKGRPELDIRRHRILFPYINARYERTPLHENDNLAAAFGYSPSRIFAGGLIEYFDRSVTDQIRSVVADAFESVGEDVWATAPVAALRYRALRLLLGGTGDWWELAAEATALLDAATREGEVLVAAHWLDLPLFYLGGDDERAVAALERHRAAGLAYRFAITAPPPVPDDRLADLLAQESRLLDELRAAWFVRLIPALPKHYRQFTVDLATIPGSGIGPDDPPVFADYDAFTDLTSGPHPFDQDDAATRAERAWAGLAEVWRRMAAFAGEYSAARAEPVTDLDAFTTALTAAPAHRGRPVGPAPVRRTDTHLERSPMPVQDDQYVRAVQLGRRAEELTDRFEQSGDPADLAAALGADIEACALVPQGTPVHLHLFNHQMMLRAVIYLHTGDESQLETAIRGLEAAIMQSKRPGVPPDLRAALRHNAATNHMHRYRRHRNLPDLDQALAHWQAATELVGVSPDRWLFLYATFVDGLLQRYHHEGDPDTLNRLAAAAHELTHLGDEPAYLDTAIAALAAAIESTPPGSPEQSQWEEDLRHARARRASTAGGARSR
jgi:tetratricopeptide (TPR) repeat protein